ncbi:MAG: hypothetical protein JSR60_08185 [Proteobacteria bacterium]|nr:hypothetical protein [Pseudomonadota bacterium]
MPSIGPEAPTAAENLAASALRLMLAGDADGGLERYSAALGSEDGAQLPCGIHAEMLARAGLGEAAARVRAIAVRAGGNLCVRGCLDASDPHEVIAEYRVLFDNGEANATMVADYLRQLSKVGATDAMARLLGPEAVCVRDVESRGEVAALATDPSAIAEAVLARVAEGCWVSARQATRDSHRIDNLHAWDDPPITALIQWVTAQFEAYRARTARYMPWMPARLSIEALAVVSTRGGHTASHIHPCGWITGVFYAAVPDGDGDVGRLRVGAPEDLAASAPGWPDLTIDPRPGRLAILPSYLTHWSTPVDTPGVRVAVVFDAAPA